MRYSICRKAGVCLVVCCCLVFVSACGYRPAKKGKLEPRVYPGIYPAVESKESKE